MSAKQKILVVDDDVQLVDSVKTLLESVGYDVAFSYQAKKGMEMAGSWAPDLILLDVMFAGPPGPDGFEVARTLHDDPKLKLIPIIMLSGVRKVMSLSYQLTPDESWMPVKAFLEKPITPDKLLSQLEKVLGPRPG